MPFAIARWPGGGVVVSDAATRRLTVMSAAGEVTREIVTIPTVNVSDLCVLPDSSILVVGPQLGDDLVTRFNRNGQIMPSPTLHVATQVPLDLSYRDGSFSVGSNECWLGLRFDNHFYAISAEGVRLRGVSVEPYQLADTARRAPERHPRIGKTTATLAITAGGRFVDIAFDGLSEGSGRVIDRYDATTRKYVASIMAPRPPVNRIVAFARTDSVFVVIHGINGLPAVSAFRLDALSPRP